MLGRGLCSWGLVSCPSVLPAGAGSTLTPCGARRPAEPQLCPGEGRPPCLHLLGLQKPNHVPKHHVLEMCRWVRSEALEKSGMEESRWQEKTGGILKDGWEP